jgi:hypothetical protein
MLTMKCGTYNIKNNVRGFGDKNLNIGTQLWMKGTNNVSY